MITLEEKIVKSILTDLGRTKFCLSNRWYCSRMSQVGSKLEYTMQKVNRRGNWGQNTIVGYVDMEKLEGDIHGTVEGLYYA